MEAGIHANTTSVEFAWMAGSRPAMTARWRLALEVTARVTQLPSTFRSHHVDPVAVFLYDTAPCSTSPPSSSSPAPFSSRRPRPARASPRSSPASSAGTWRSGRLHRRRRHRRHRLADLRRRRPRGAGAKLLSGLRGHQVSPARPICSTSPGSCGRRPSSRRRPRARPSGRAACELFLGGLAVTMGNPKVMVFYLALLPNLIDLGPSHSSAMPSSFWSPSSCSLSFLPPISCSQPAQGAFSAARAPCASSIAARGRNGRRRRWLSRRAEIPHKILKIIGKLADFP